MDAAGTEITELALDDNKPKMELLDHDVESPLFMSVEKWFVRKAFACEASPAIFKKNNVSLYSSLHKKHRS